VHVAGPVLADLTAGVQLGLEGGAAALDSGFHPGHRDSRLVGGRGVSSGVEVDLLHRRGLLGW